MRHPHAEELTRQIHEARKAGLPDVVLAMQNAVGLIASLQRDSDALRTLRELLKG
jgi:hypothetical protein